MGIRHGHNHRIFPILVIQLLPLRLSQVDSPMTKKTTRPRKMRMATIHLIQQPLPGEQCHRRRPRFLLSDLGDRALGPTQQRTFHDPVLFRLALTIVTILTKTSYPP